MSQPQPKGRCIKTKLPTSVYFWWIREADSLASNNLWWSMDGSWDFPMGFSHWATPAATSDWWIFCSQSCACLSSLSPWTACQGWIWRKYTFQSEDLWVKYDYCVVSESPQNSATGIGLLLQKPHIATSELRCWGADLFPPSMCWIGCSLMFLQSQSR